MVPPYGYNSDEYGYVPSYPFIQRVHLLNRLWFKKGSGWRILGPFQIFLRFLFGEGFVKLFG